MDILSSHLKKRGLESTDAFDISTDKKIKSDYSKVIGTKADADLFAKLPVELIDDILAYCSRQDILSLNRTSRAMYSLSIRSLFVNFDQLRWSSVANLSRRLAKGFGSDGCHKLALASTAAKSIRSMTFQKVISRNIDDRFYTMIEDDIHRPSWVAQHARDCLVEILEKTTGLISFKCLDVLHDVDADKLWVTLAKLPLKELHVAKTSYDKIHDAYIGYSPFTKSSNLWTIKDLTNIHLEFSERDERNNCRASLFGFLKNSPQLQQLKLAYNCKPFRAWPKSTIDELRKLKSLKSLDIARFDIDGLTEGDAVLQLLGDLVHLQKLRLVGQIMTRYSRDVAERRLLEEQLTEAIDGFKFPALQDIEMSDGRLLVKVLRHSEPQIIRNVKCQESTFTMPYYVVDEGCPQLRNLRATLSTKSSIKQLEISIYTYSCKEQVEAMFRAVPTSVERLAIRLPEQYDNNLANNYYELTKDYVPSLDHLHNLKRLILPWDAIFCYRSDTNHELNDEELLFKVKEKAIEIASQFSNTNLEYVFFQGSKKVLQDSPSWRASFEADDDLGKRFAVKINRRAKDSQIESPLIEVISTSCMCNKCYRVEDLDVKKRYCHVSSSCMCSKCYRVDCIDV